MTGGLAPSTGFQTIAMESGCTVLSSEITGAPSDVIGADVIVWNLKKNNDTDTDSNKPDGIVWH